MSRRCINRGRVRLEQLRAEATERAEVRAGRSIEEQVAVLDQRLGVGVGASKERARLEREIERLTEERKSGKTDRRKKSSEPRTRSDRKKAKARRHAEREKRGRVEGEGKNG